MKKLDINKAMFQRPTVERSRIEPFRVGVANVDEVVKTHSVANRGLGSRTTHCNRTCNPCKYIGTFIIDDYAPPRQVVRRYGVRPGWPVRRVGLTKIGRSQATEVAHCA